MLTQPSNTKEKLMRAAMDIVAADGFGAATTAAIADRSGMAEGTLYRHFKSKDELMIAAYRQLKADVFERVSAETGDSASIRDRARAMWLGMWNTYCHDLPAFTFGQRFGESALSSQEGGTAHERIMDHLCAIIKDGQVSGEIRDLPRDVLVAFFFPPMMAMLKQFNQGKTWSQAEIDAAIGAAWQAWAVPGQT